MVVFHAQMQLRILTLSIVFILSHLHEFPIFLQSFGGLWVFFSMKLLIDMFSTSFEISSHFSCLFTLVQICSTSRLINFRMLSRLLSLEFSTYKSFRRRSSKNSDWSSFRYQVIFVPLLTSVNHLGVLSARKRDSWSSPSQGSKSRAGVCPRHLPSSASDLLFHLFCSHGLSLGLSPFALPAVGFALLPAIGYAHLFLIFSRSSMYFSRSSYPCCFLSAFHH